MIIKRSFLVVGNSLNQTRSIVKYLKLNYPYASVKQIFTEVSLREHTKKNISNLGFILLALRVMCFGENSLLGYSFWHNAFQQKKSNSFLMRFIYILIANFARRFPLFSYDIRRFIELLYIRSKSSIKGFNYDAVFFTGIMSTQIEIDAYFICLKNNVKTIYWPFNWDNPFGKMYLPTFKFSIGLCWGSQMKNWMTKLDAFRMTQEIPHPRLSYLLDVHMKRKNNKKNIVLVALSQKPGTSFFFLIEAISKLCQKKNIYIKFIVRPHPYEPLNSNILNNYLIDNLNIEIDKVYIQILSKYTKNIIPASFEEIQSKLDKSLIDNLRLARLVITEAGTITAESLALDIPVISLMNNYTNQTMRTHVHATHFSSITNNKNLLMIFSNEGIDDKLNQFLDSVHFFDDNQKVETFNKVPEIINLSNLKKKIKYL